MDVAGKERIRLHIESRIFNGALKAGEKLPPLRELAREFQLTPSAVRRALESLCDGGLLEFRHGSGIFVCERRSRQNAAMGDRINVFVSGNNRDSDYCAHALIGVRKLAEESGWGVNLYFNECRPGRLDPGELAAGEALIFLGCYDQFLSALPGNAPGVGLEMVNSYNGRLSTISLDPVAGAEIAVDYFVGKNIERVIVFGSEMPSYRFRGEMFSHRFRRIGGQCATILWPEATLDCLKDENTGYLFVGDSICQPLAAGFRAATGEYLYRKRVILGMDGKSRLFADYEPFPSIAVDWEYAGKLVMEECIRRITQPGLPGRKIYLYGQLTEPLA